VVDESLEGELSDIMDGMNSFLSKFGGGGAEEAPESTLLNAGSPNALGKFFDQFSTLTESYWFYGNTEELRYDTKEHKYFRVDPELGNLTELAGVTSILRIIDRSAALVPWASKKCAEKILRTVPLAPDSLMLAPISLVDFTKLVLEAKDAHREILEDAGDVGHAAHKCLEDSITNAIEHTDGVVQELLNLPTDEKALSCARSAFTWMGLHKVKWLCTERKIYSKKYGYAGTADGLAWVNSCNDASCCAEQYEKHLALIDWKSSNDLHTEYCYQTAAYLQALIEEFRK
jgi:hypothetical protein